MPIKRSDDDDSGHRHGGLIDFERNYRRAVAIIFRALEHHDPIVVPPEVVAQAWRDESRQTRLARLLGSPLCEVIAFDDRQASPQSSSAGGQCPLT